MTFPQSIHFIVSEAVRFVSPIEIAMEWILVAFVAALVTTLGRFFARPLSFIVRGFRTIAGPPRVTMLTCAVLPVVLRLLLLPFVPVPEPSIHDEFSHLLLADTLAHGRITNRTPAMWTHFETIHVIQKPTYNSMYPPAQGVFLAVGEVLFHEPWAGVELGIALMCAAMYWMFLGWLPRRWAFFGVLLAIVRLALVGFWVNSYMGGSVPAIGGALVVGSMPRLRADTGERLHAFLFGLGAVILMNSRPFEGGVLTAVVLALLLPSLIGKFRTAPGEFFRSLVTPALVVLILGAGCLGYYCWRVTGQVTQMPYQVNRASYGWPENLAFLPSVNVTLKDPVLHAMHDVEIAHHGIYNTIPGLIDNLVTRLFDNWAYLIGPVLTIPFLVPLFSFDRKFRSLIYLLLAAATLNLFQLLLYPYHLAPVIPVIFCLIAIGSQRIFAWLTRLGAAQARCFAILLPLALLFATTVKQFGDELDIPTSSYWERGYEWHRDARAAIVNWLRMRPGNHLVIVRYAPGHPVNQEWVYNGTRLDKSKIIWAREMDKASDLELLKYYNDRKAWLVEADVYPQRVVPYRFLDEGLAPEKRCSPCSNCPQEFSK